MKITYLLKIESDRLSESEISKLLGVETSRSNYESWTLELVEEALDPSIKFVDKFLSILETRYETLSHFGIMRSDISVWIYYEYDEQCNLEFLPIDMKRLGENGISLCITCWQSAN